MEKIILSILTCAFIGWIVFLGYKDVQATSQLKENLGKKVVLNNDTLMILNYNYSERTYILEDGQIVHYFIAIDNLIK